MDKVLNLGGAALTTPETVHLEKGSYFRKGLDYPVYIIPKMYQGRKLNSNYF